MSDEPQQEQQLQIEVPPEQEVGVYANFALVASGPHDLMIDFCQLAPRREDELQPRARVVSRVRIAPSFVGPLLQAISTNAFNRDELHETPTEPGGGELSTVEIGPPSLSASPRRNAYRFVSTEGKASYAATREIRSTLITLAKPAPDELRVVLELGKEENGVWAHFEELDVSAEGEDANDAFIGAISAARAWLTYLRDENPSSRPSSRASAPTFRYSTHPCRAGFGTSASSTSCRRG